MKDFKNFSDEDFKFIAEQIPVGVYQTDKKGKCLYVNPAWCTMSGITFEQALGDGWAEAIYHLDKEKIFTKWNMMIENGAEFSEELRFQKPDGQILWIFGSAKPMLNKRGKISGYIGTSTDITRGKESEEKYKKLVETLIEGIWQIDKDAVTTYVNPRMCEIIGYSEEEMMGKHIFHFMDKEGVRIAENNLKRRADGISEKHDFEFIRKDKKRIFTRISTNPLYDDKGNYSGALAAIEDVTAQKFSEKELNESKQRFELAMEATQDGLFDWNLITNKIYYSPGWKRMLGYEDHEIDNTFSEWERLTNAEDVKESWNILNDCLEGKRPRFEIEFQMKHKDGHWVDIFSRANVIFNEIGKPIRVVGTHLDITERKNIEKEILRYKDHLEELVNERTKELAEKNNRLEEFNNLFIGREFRIKELKDKIKELENRNLS